MNKNIFTFLHKKPMIVCIHGYGKRRTHEFNALYLYFSKKGYSISMPELFDQTNPLDTDPHMWIRRAEIAVENALLSHRKVIIIGFSMGGVIASYCAMKYSIHQCFLIAPAFEYITIKLVRNLVSSKVTSRFIAPLPSHGPYPDLPEHFNNTFTEVVALTKLSIKGVKCPVVIFHGTEDERIPVRSSEYAYNHIEHNNKKLILFQGAFHRLLDDTKYQQDILQIIEKNILEFR